MLITTQDPWKHSETMAAEEVPKNPVRGSSFRSRRSRSDLGLKSKSFRSKRTLALLQNPSMRKHVAQSMGLNPDDPCFIEMVTSKLDLAHLSESTDFKDEIVSPPLLLPPPPPPPSVLLHSKMSASSGDIQMGSLSIAPDARTKSEPDIADMCSPRGRQQRTHIPSFDEFRTRLRNMRCRPASTSFEFLSVKENFNSAHSSQLNKTLATVASEQSLANQCGRYSGANLKSPCEQTVRFVEDVSEELTLDIYDLTATAAAAKPSCRKSEEITSDLEEEFSEISTARSNMCENLNMDPQVSVLRSTSDVSDMVAEESRNKGVREKRTKPYKSDPFCTTTQNGGSPPTPPSVIYENTTDGMSKDDVLSFLHHVTQTEDIARSNSMRSLEGSGKPKAKSRETCKRSKSTYHRRSQVSSFYEIYDVARSSETGSCVMCRLTDISCPGSFVCDGCREMSAERRKSIQEIIETEKNFYRNLVTLRDEFYVPLQSSGLLSSDQLKSVFSNLYELVSISKQFRRQLSDSLSLAIKKGDLDYVTVLIGRPFLESSSMLLAFETYCTAQSSAQNILEQLMEEKNLLRLFLEESLKENEALRRMDLKTFLMLPVQRIMKYPLLLARLLKTTPKNHRDHNAIVKAKSRMEEILEHINMKSKGTVSMRSKRKSAWANIVKKANTAEDIELNKAALEVLGWSRHEAYCLHTGHLHHAIAGDHLWSQRVNTLKFHTAHAVLVSHGRNPNLEMEASQQPLLFPHDSKVKEVALVLFRDKNGRFLQLREHPISLAQCVVSREPDVPDVFLLAEVNNESFIMKGDDAAETGVWFHLLRLHGKDMGRWRRRRKALPNIMMHHKP